eukprot:jgi/Botrbrau1/13077/Bobra.0187s0039.1
MDMDDFLHCHLTVHVPAILKIIQRVRPCELAESDNAPGLQERSQQIHLHPLTGLRPCNRPAESFSAALIQMFNDIMSSDVSRKPASSFGSGFQSDKNVVTIV